MMLKLWLLTLSFTMTCVIVSTFITLNPTAVTLYRQDDFELFLQTSLVNDEYFLKQWYMLPRERTTRILDRSSALYEDDLGIMNVWVREGNFGQGITVLIFDDGIDADHPDLTPLDLNFSYDFVDDDPHPNHVPISNERSDSDGRGTMIAGIIGMKANNMRCGAGIAPLVKLGAIRVLGGSKQPYPQMETTLLRRIGMGFRFNTGDVDVTVLPPFSGPWNPNEDMITFHNDLLYSMSEGRRGRGTLHIVPAGDMKEKGYTCSLNPIINNIYTITVAAAEPSGHKTLYSEICSSVMITAYSSNPRNLDTSNYKGILTTTPNGGCSEDKFGGTSAAAAIVAGVVAQTLKANPYLTWRDVFHLMIFTANSDVLDNNDVACFINGGGFKYCDDFGFGLINAASMVSLAKRFQHVPTFKKFTLPLINPGEVLDFGSELTFVRSAVFKKITSNHSTSEFVEQVTINLKMVNPTRNDFELSLFSPYGTEEKFHKFPTNKNAKRVIANWGFRSVKFWGEHLEGQWIVFITAKHPQIKIEDMTLTIYGTELKPSHYHGE